MIELRNITKSYQTTKGRVYIFRDLSLTIPSHRSVALIGRNGAGKSTLMRLLGGLDAPDKGSIITPQSISWPVGLSGGFQGSLTARENVKFVARVYGAEGEKLKEIVNYVKDFAEIGDYFDRPVNTFSSGMRAKVAFGLSLAFEFDYYLIDEAMSVGDAHFKAKAAKAFEDRVSTANVILVTHGMSQVRKMCDLVVVLHKGEAFLYDDVEEGIKVYESL